MKMSNFKDSATLRIVMGILFFVLSEACSLFGQTLIKGQTNVNTIIVADSSSWKNVDSNSVNKVSKPEPIENIGANISTDSSMTFINDDFDFEQFYSVGKIISYYSPAFVNSFGTFGHPEFINLYDSDNLTFLSDNISQTDFGSVNPFDFSLTGIEKIEIVPLTRAFLFSKNLNNSVVNIVSRDTVVKVPLTKIRYFQSKNDEGEISLFFSKQIASRLSLSFNLSNKAVASDYKNSDFSHWSGFVKLKYLLNNKINLIMSYSQIKSIVGLNGGVNVDSIKNGLGESNYQSILYNNYLAPVVFPNRYLKQSGRNLLVSFVSKFSTNEFFTARVYYSDNLKELRSNEHNEKFSENIPKILNNTSENKLGVDFKNSFSTDFIQTEVFGNLEKQKVSSPIYINKINSTNGSLGAILTLKGFSKILLPSLFANSVFYDGNKFFGYGTDINFASNHFYSFAAGVSYYEKPFPLFVKKIGQINKSKVFTAECSGNFTVSNSSLKLTAFYVDKKNAPFAFSTEPEQQYLNPEKIDFGLTDKSTIGGNLFANINYSKFQLITNATYKYSLTFDNIQDLPYFTANAGLFYKDSLFSNNLYLKTGINVFFRGRQNNLFYNFETGSPVRFYKTDFDKIFTLPYDGSEKSFTIDFTLLGRIQNRATFFFIFENLTDKEYFVVPYYPEKSRGIRFGIEWDINN